MLARIPSILIVDDTPTNLLALEAVLTPLEARIVSARSGEEALSLTQQNDFALALVDLRMPGLDGSQTAALMRERPAGRRVPVIILTAHTLSEEQVEQAYASGVVDILQKPFSVSVLRTKVALFLELERQREQLLLQEKQLREDFERQLIGIVSHDLRSPLSAVALGAEHLAKAELPAFEHQIAERLKLAARRAVRLTHDLLDLTSIRHTGRLPLTPDRHDVYELVAAAVDELRSLNPTCVLELERSGDTRAELDGERVGQAIVNLLGNAVRHASDHAVRVRVDGKGSEICVEVHNLGDPIPEEVMQTLFEPFKRGSAENSAKRSVGLGLFIVDQIVRAHGGYVSATSTRETGTTFTLSLPRSPRMSPAHTAGAPFVENGE